MKILSHSLGFFFTQLIVPLAMQKFFRFIKSHWSIVGLSSWANGVLFRKSLPMLLSRGGTVLSFLLDITVFQVSCLGL